MSVYVPDLGVDEARTADEAEKRGKGLIREPLVYGRNEQRSYFADMASAQITKDTAAGERLDHHRRQMAALPTETRVHPNAEVEYRLNPTTETGKGLEFAPPLWLNELFATAPRAGEIIQRLVRERGNEFLMPKGAASINLPRITKGTVVNDVTSGAVVDNQDVETATVKAQALIYSGQSDWSLQSLEQSPKGAHLDWAMFKDMAESLDAELEMDLVAGRGEAFNEALGLLNITGINGVTWTEATPKVEKAFPPLAEAMAKVGVNRDMPPDAWLLTSSRLAWLAMSEESPQRPLILTDNVGDDWPLASMAGVGIYLDEAITRKWSQANKTSGGGTEEPMFSVRSNDFLLWHSAPTTAVYEEVLSGTLQVRFMLYRTTASMLHRYPSGISAVTGTGTIPVTNF